MKLVPRNTVMDIIAFIADKRLTTNVALSPSHAYSSSASGANKLREDCTRS